VRLARSSRGPAGVDNPAQWKRERAAAILDEARYIGRVEN
jgi:hypothetical protein